MDKRRLRSSSRLQFSKLLTTYRERHGLSFDQMCKLLERPRSTVGYWLQGKRMPARKDIRAICARLNVNYEHVFASEVVREAFFESSVIGLDAIQSRYADLVKGSSVMAAMEYVTIASVVVFNRLVRAGLDVVLEAHSDFQNRIRCLDASLQDLSVVVQANGLAGIGLVVYTSDGGVHSAWEALSDLHVLRVIDNLLSRLT